MKINAENYAEYIICYELGELSQEESDELMSFLSKNPDLKPNFIIEYYWFFTYFTIRKLGLDGGFFSGGGVSSETSSSKSKIIPFPFSFA